MRCCLPVFLAGGGSVRLFLAAPAPPRTVRGGQLVVEILFVWQGRSGTAFPGLPPPPPSWRLLLRRRFQGLYRFPPRPTGRASKRAGPPPRAGVDKSWDGEACHVDARGGRRRATAGGHRDDSLLVSGGRGTAAYTGVKGDARTVGGVQRPVGGWTRQAAAQPGRMAGAKQPPGCACHARGGGPRRGVLRRPRRVRRRRIARGASALSAAAPAPAGDAPATHRGAGTAPRATGASLGWGAVGGGCTAVRKAPRSPRSRPRPVGAGPPRWGHAPAPPRDAPARDAPADGPWPAPPWASRPVTAAGCGWGRRGAGRAALPATHSPPPMAVERTPLPGHGEERAVLSPALPPPPHPSARGGLPTPRILAGRGVFGTLPPHSPPPNAHRLSPAHVAPIAASAGGLWRACTPHGPRPRRARPRIRRRCVSRCRCAGPTPAGGAPSPFPPTPRPCYFIGLSAAGAGGRARDEGAGGRQASTRAHRARTDAHSPHTGVPGPCEAHPTPATGGRTRARAGPSSCAGAFAFSVEPHRGRLSPAASLAAPLPAGSRHTLSLWPASKRPLSPPFCTPTPPPPSYWRT